MIIVIDPGHGGSDPGAVGPAGTQEKDHALAISLYMREMLEQCGHQTILTRESDMDVAAADATAGEELGARVRIANLAAADIFVSLHINAAASPQAHGAETWYYRSGLELAQCIQTELVKLGLTDRGIKQAGFYVLKNTGMPAVLVELAFITNPDEELLLGSDDFRKRAAEKIVQGILRYFA